MKDKAPDRSPKQYDKRKMMILRLVLGALIVAWIGVANYLGVGINARLQ